MNHSPPNPQEIVVKRDPLRFSTPRLLQLILLVGTIFFLGFAILCAALPWLDPKQAAQPRAAYMLIACSFLFATLAVVCLLSLVQSTHSYEATPDALIWHRPIKQPLPIPWSHITRIDDQPTLQRLLLRLSGAGLPTRLCLDRSLTGFHRLQTLLIKHTDCPIASFNPDLRRDSASNSQQAELRLTFEVPVSQRLLHASVAAFCFLVAGLGLAFPGRLPNARDQAIHGLGMACFGGVGAFFLARLWAFRNRYQISPEGITRLRPARWPILMRWDAITWINDRPVLNRLDLHGDTPSGPSVFRLENHLAGFDLLRSAILIHTPSWEQLIDPPEARAEPETTPWLPAVFRTSAYEQLMSFLCRSSLIGLSVIFSLLSARLGRLFLVYSILFTALLQWLSPRIWQALQVDTDNLTLFFPRGRQEVISWNSVQAIRLRCLDPSRSNVATVIRITLRDGRQCRFRIQARRGTLHLYRALRQACPGACDL
jgi:hypothetical protein